MPADNLSAPMWPNFTGLLTAGVLVDLLARPRRQV